MRSSKTRSATSSRRAAAAALLGLALACGLPSDSDKGTVAVLDGRELTVAELEAYFALNLMEDHAEDVTEDESDRVKSRLFDNFLDEQILLAEADRAGVLVSDEEVGLYLEMDSGEDRPAVEPGSVQWEAVREVLMVQKFRESFLRREVTVSPEAVGAYLAENRKRLLPERELVLRSLLLNSSAQADRVYQQIRRRRLTFAEAVVAYATEPGQGVPVEISLDSLPPKLREAIQDLKPGGVTKPVELHGSTYLFQLESWEARRVLNEEDLRERARGELLQQRREEALEKLMRDLQREAQLKIRRGNLPFRYLPEDPA